MDNGIFSLTYLFENDGKSVSRKVFEAFQFAASQHAEALGCGEKALRENGLLWVIVSEKYEITGDIPCGEATVQTWVRSASGLFTERDYRITVSGKKVASGVSRWTTIDEKTRKLKANPLAGEPTYRERESILEKIHGFDGGKHIRTVSVKKSDFDANCHVNNACYAEFAEKAVNGNISSMQIDFHNEITEEKDTFISVSDDGKILKCKDGDKLIFLAKIERK